MTDQGTRHPRTEADLVDATGLKLGQVRAVLTALARAGLARPLDAARAQWELSHDFVARVVARLLGQTRRTTLRRAAYYAAPSLLLLTLAGIAGAVAWERTADDRAMAALARAGIRVGARPEHAGELMVERTSGLSPDSVAAARDSLARIAARTTEARFPDTPPAAVDLLAVLTALQSLNLSSTRVSDLKPLERLTALQGLDLLSTQVSAEAAAAFEGARAGAGLPAVRIFR